MPPEVEQDARRIGGGEEKHIGHRYQWGALPPRGDVAGPEAAHHPHPESLGQHRRLAELPD